MWIKQQACGYSLVVSSAASGNRNAIQIDLLWNRSESWPVVRRITRGPNEHEARVARIREFLARCSVNEWNIFNPVE